LLSYTRNLQHAFTSSEAEKTDFDAWPLELGLEKLRQSERIKAKQRRFRSFPDVTLVLSYCHLIDDDYLYNNVYIYNMDYIWIIYDYI
jgi:hypothetical protein